MASNTFYQIEGLDQFEKALETLDSKTVEKIYSSVNRKVANKEVKKPLAARVDYIHSKRNIKTTKSKDDKTAITVSPSTDIYWTRFLEKGTKERYTKTTGAYRGSITARHQIESVYEAQIDEILKYVQEYYGEEIDNILRRKIKKISK